jgi:hypothetical protein
MALRWEFPTVLSPDCRIYPCRTSLNLEAREERSRMLVGLDPKIQTGAAPDSKALCLVEQIPARFPRFRQLSEGLQRLSLDEPCPFFESRVAKVCDALELDCATKKAGPT